MAKATAGTLLDQLKALKPELPEVTCFVPAWGREIRLRALTLGQGFALRRAAGDDQEKLLVRAIAHAIVDGDEHPLANEEGVRLIENLPQASATRLIDAFNAVGAGTVADAEKNSAPRAGVDGSSTVSPSPSDAPSLN